MSRDELTKRQHNILTWIADYDRVHDEAPTLREIGDHFDVTKQTARKHVRVLDRKGWVHRTAQKERAIDVLATPEEQPDP